MVCACVMEGEGWGVWRGGGGGGALDGKGVVEAGKIKTSAVSFWQDLFLAAAIINNVCKRWIAQNQVKIENWFTYT